MGLTVKKLQRLKNKGFPELYDNHAAEWEALLNNAVEFLDNALPEGERILPDDIQRTMSEMVTVHPHFKTFVEENSITQQYFSADFADYIIDRKYGGEIVQRGQGDDE